MYNLTNVTNSTNYIDWTCNISTATSSVLGITLIFILALVVFFVFLKEGALKALAGSMFLASSISAILVTWQCNGVSFVPAYIFFIFVGLFALAILGLFFTNR